MEVKTGYIYHIKDEFFDKANDKGLMINHENEKQCSIITIGYVLKILVVFLLFCNCNEM